MLVYKILVILVVANLDQSHAQTNVQGPKSVSVPVPVITDKDLTDAKMLEYKNSFDEILKDLINNWQSPIRYLKSRGYLTKELEHDVQLTNLTDPLDATQAIGPKALPTVGNKLIQKKANARLSLQRGTRAAVNESGLIRNLKGVLSNLFASKDDIAGKNFRSINLDIDELKLNARKEAQKYYEEVLKKLVERGEFRDDVTEKTKSLKSSISVQKPKYLKWDLKGNHLRFTTSSKDEYLRGLVKAFAKKGTKVKVNSKWQKE